MLFIFPIYLLGWEGEYWLLGKMTPNLWHNGSTIYVFPFCFLLFQEVSRWFESQKVNLSRGLILTSLIVLIKPNYLFGLLPGMLLLFLFSNHVPKFRQRILTYSGITIALLVISKYLIFDMASEQSLFYNFRSSGAILFQPFSVWLEYSESLVLDLISSLVFLLGGVFLFRKVLFKDKEFQLAFAVFFFSLLVFFLFAESGPRYLDGNFYWQVPISLFLLYLVLVKIVLKEWCLKSSSENASLSKFILLIVLFGFHVLSGLLYLHSMVRTGNNL
ncbi:hypothetical protein [Algoriphagus boseongensis]|nr:hypothetical protein [Algoriphagus boseongensis]